MARLLRFLPWSRAAMAWWGWRNRRQLLSWIRFVPDAARRLAAGERADVLAEARLRAAIAGDAVTRRERHLELSVRDGRAILGGRVSARARDRALAVARETRGVRAVDDRLAVPRRGGARTDDRATGP